jgi:hypothetical protein
MSFVGTTDCRDCFHMEGPTLTVYQEVMTCTDATLHCCPTKHGRLAWVVMMSEYP